ncbi:class I SAM-dependent methyltransferase [Clostridium sp. AM58-1XD]|uniref:class I SAM-dependent methyltransferase n=1 Tax=Clostridium sp. AM58-1XD TaxID=2292307 RepID=UPI000E4C9229|nr:class I SAM-dependent methyltransferase [Clostridium sp. AM58-1XD]RGY99923.1 methyltransferase domain-containing protein [Clostridium sp. AM58-1XD]
MRKCIACGGALFDEPLMRLDSMPSSAQNIPDEAEVKADEGISLELCQCSECGLVQFDCEPVDYYRDVIRAGGFSTTMVNLRREQYRHLIETYHLEGKRFIEVGCGRGEFLSVLTEFPVKAYGIEHKKELVQIAREQGLNVTEGFTEYGNGTIEGAAFDCFLSFNFLEHQPCPNTMLQAIYNSLSEGGMGLVTVPSLEYILQYDGYYELIRDHIAYYTFESLRNLMENNGFEVLEEEMVNRDTISMIVGKAPEKRQENPGGRPYITGGHKVTRLNAAGLKKSREVISEEVNGLIDSLHGDGRTAAIWGASHQGFTLAATTKLGEKVAYIIDSAPFKQGRFAPASHIKIVPPDHWKEEPVDAILIVAPGYTDEIAGIIREKFVKKDGGRPEILTLKSNHLERL